VLTSAQSLYGDKLHVERELSSHERRLSPKLTWLIRELLDAPYIYRFFGSLGSDTVATHRLTI
jgi:hypothetical protein